VVFEPGGPDLAVSTSLPVVRDYERKIYIKPEVGGLMVGAFEGPHRSMPAEIAQRNAGALAVPADASHELYDEEYDKVESGLMAAMALIPGLGSCGIKARTCTQWTTSRCSGVRHARTTSGWRPASTAAASRLGPAS
jgi:hypothetical protein